MSFNADHGYHDFSTQLSRGWIILGLWIALSGSLCWADTGRAQTSASSAQPDAPSSGAMDGDRFGVEPSRAWKGNPEATSWWWQCRWDEPREVGTIVQIIGDDSLRLRNAPQKSKWQASFDGQQWNDLEETAVESERRTFRVHRLKISCRLRYLRLKIDSVKGSFPTLREVETYTDTNAAITFPDWILVVSTLDQPEWDKGHPAGSEFVALARRCPEWAHVPAQHVWLDSFDECFVSTEPRPVCAFLTGNFSDWCQKDRTAWRGTQEVLSTGRLPLWAACGGAQGLAILAEVGVDSPWDCPHCRDPNNPKASIYGHIGHTGSGKLKCGDYTTCVFERGPTNVLQIADDPVFEGLPREFRIMESHCGQIAHVPKGWIQIATKGAGGKTDLQCLRVADRCIYAAQFHIEMAGTPENSQQLMANFLRLAKAWGGYNPQAKSLPPPRPFVKQ